MIEDAIANAVSAALTPVVTELAGLREQVARLVAAGPPRMGSVADAARVLGVCELTIRRKFAAGEIAGRRIGRRVVLDLSSLKPVSGDEIARLAREARGL